MSDFVHAQLFISATKRTSSTSMVCSRMFLSSTVVRDDFTNQADSLTFAQ
nr:MAG TPA: hypothetical protein [Bacteriophage sp.]DAY51001.1 MAG TPA: hypothetical protein [Caudoviricetes sp.]